MKKILVFALIAAMITAFALPAFASNVTYINAQQFVFAPGSEYELSDLFENFKNVMPGDSRTQTITVKNDVSRNVDVKLYLRSLGEGNEGTEGFLKELDLKVEQDGKVIFDSSPDETAQLTDWVLLGEFDSGTQTDLDLTLTVPIELDTKFSGAIGYVDWQFMVEEIDRPTPTPDPGPKTGDESEPVLYIALAAAALAAIAAIAVVLIKRRKADN